MEDWIPFLMFGGWALLSGTLLLVGKRTLRRAVRERVLLHGGRHEWREASVLEFPRVKPEFYDFCQAELEELGFRVAGDMEDATLAGTTDNPHTFRRVMIARDGLVVAQFWRVNFPPVKRLLHSLFKGLGDARFIRLYCEGANGRLYELRRTPGKSRESIPETMALRSFDGKAVPSAMWKEFSAGLAEYLTEHPDFGPRQFRFLDDVIQSEGRQQDQRVALRKIKGLLTREELLQEGMPEKSVDGYLKAFSKELRRQGGWPRVETAQKEANG